MRGGEDALIARNRRTKITTLPRINTDKRGSGKPKRSAQKSAKTKGTAHRSAFQIFLRLLRYPSCFSGFSSPRLRASVVRFDVYCFVSWPVPESPPQRPPVTVYVPLTWVGAAGLFKAPTNSTVLASSFLKKTSILRPTMILPVAVVPVAKQGEPT
jgi:hypothetical protein